MAAAGRRAWRRRPPPAAGLDFGSVVVRFGLGRGPLSSLSLYLSDVKDKMVCVLCG